MLSMARVLPAQRLCPGLATARWTMGKLQPMHPAHSDGVRCGTSLPGCRCWEITQQRAAGGAGAACPPASGWAVLCPRIRLPHRLASPLSEPLLVHQGTEGTHTTRSEREDNVEVERGRLQPVPMFIKDKETASSAGVVHTALLAQGSGPEAAAPQPAGPSSGC